jgi:hypothetical protein
VKFLCLCYYDPAEFAALSPEQLASIHGLCAPHDQALRDSGHCDFVASLSEPETARVVRPVDGGAPRVEAGAYATTREPVGAFFLIDAADLDAAVKIASLHPGAHLGRFFGGGIEVRAVDHFIEP